MKTTKSNKKTTAESIHMMQLQRDFMDCWLTALDTPMHYRVIIELDSKDRTNAWIDENGKKHSLNKYIMIDGSNGIKLFDDNKWLISSSWKKDPILVNPEEVLPRALQVIDGGHVKEIYNDGI